MTDASKKSGEFETFKSEWLLQVAADRLAKSALPIAIVLACRHLNRKTGTAWPGIETLVTATGAEAANTVRNALKLIEERGHAKIEWTKGGKGRTNVVAPLVDGKPFKNLKGIDLTEPFKNLKGSERANPSISDDQTLQVSKSKPFKKLKGNHLIEPFEEPSEGGGAPQAPAADHSDFEFDFAPYAPDAAPMGASGAVEREDQFFLASENVSEFLQTLDQDDVIRAFDEAAHQKIVALAMYAPDPIAGQVRINRLLEMGELTLVTLAETLEPDNCHARPA